jgi:hypothetical protein
MMFFYQQKRKIKEEENAENATEHIVEDCFNTDCVLRGQWHSPDEFLVYLNDGHEQAENKQMPKFKNGQVVGVEMTRVREWYCSIITLNKEDAQRFKELTNGKN